MRLKTLELNGFKSFSQKTILEFQSPVVSVVGPNGSGKSNVVEAIRFVLGEQSMKSMRGRAGADLIFKGSKNLPKGTKASVTIYFNNQDKVFKLSDESGENVDLNYEIISISREVYADGLNKYILNGTEVRLKDINALLASVNVGASGHHIISQGEADRILNANPKDRREMVEDALGLKVYQYKIKESSRKLEKTENNIKEVNMLRRENAPHLNFLRRQVEKFEKTKELQVELGLFYKEYLKKESVYLNREEEILNTEKDRLSNEIKTIADKIAATEDNDFSKENKKIAELRNTENTINEIRREQGELERKLGRIEGMLDSKIENTGNSGKCPTCGREIVELNTEQIELRKNNEQEISELKKSKEELINKIKELENRTRELHQIVDRLKREINEEMESLRDLEREKFALKVKHQELLSSLNLINVRSENLHRESVAFENEIQEGVALIGQEVLSYRDYDFEGPAERHLQEELKKKIERIKIKLEDAGMGNGAEVMKEYKEVSLRDEFLSKELEDLSKSIESIEKLIAELKEKIDSEFKEGIKKINVEFQEFFSLMFGGGTGKLSVVVENKKKRRDSDEEIGDGEDEELVFEHGIEINVSLPHKKVKELHALSGGERSLTSIALLFAMSQVNPPPFLVLDETDAALDEANSRKYGDMIEKLSHHSQLIVVTHNRETMSRAGVLYGVTIGSDGASKLLSVKFDEAAAIAK